MPEHTERQRDRAATETSLLAAARGVLADVGFQGLGVNAVARAAGCDKQLIYRYFGGLDGLIDAIGAGIAEDWRRRLAPLSPATSYAAFAEAMMLGFLDALIADPLMQKIMVWEIAEPSPLVQRLTLARSKAMMRWVAESRGTLAPPAGVDIGATNAALLAAIQHLVLAAAAAGQFSGLPLASDSDWERVRAVVRRLVRAAFAG
ncbi:MAG: TetR/AcrR family transcriptional regulator [Rhizobiaceae bacterium]